MSHQRNHSQCCEFLLPLIVIVVELCPNMTFAQKKLSCQDDRGCYDLSKRAYGYYQQKEYKESARLYQLAFDLYPNINFLFDIATCYARSGDHDKAEIYYLRYVRANPQDEKHLNIAQEWLNSYQQKKSRVEQKPPAAIVIPPPPPPRSPEPVYKRWWLWTVVGTAVAGGIAATIGLSVYTSGPDVSGVPVHRPFGP